MQIPPGGEGKISIKVFTEGYGGRRLTKTIAVYTNDKKHKRIKLVITGQVEKFTVIKPRMVRLVGDVNKKIKEIVKIIPIEKYPYKIIGVNAEKKGVFKLKLRKAKNTVRLEYLFTIENLRKESGFYSDIINIKTDSKIMPVFKIKVSSEISGKIEKVIQRKKVVKRLRRGTKRKKN